MSSPYIGEIRMFGGNFAPAGWAMCEGQLMPISENDALFTLIGTTYGGDGQETFGIPDLRGRIPIHQGTNGQTFILGEQAGTESVTLTTQQIPIHNHAWVASNGAAQANTAQDNVPSATVPTIYQSAAPAAVMNAAMISPSGGSQPHDNMMPFLCVNFIISLFGVFPTQN